MPEEKKEKAKETAPADAVKELTPENKITKKAAFKKETPWEHFKQKGGGKNMSKHGFARQNLNRRTGGG